MVLPEDIFIGPKTLAQDHLEYTKCLFADIPVGSPEGAENAVF